MFFYVFIYIIELLHFIKLFDFLEPIFYYTSHLILLAVVTHKFLNTPFYFLKCEQIQIFVVHFCKFYISAIILYHSFVTHTDQVIELYRLFNHIIETIKPSGWSLRF